MFIRLASVVALLGLSAGCSGKVRPPMPVPATGTLEVSPSSASTDEGITVTVSVFDASHRTLPGITVTLIASGTGNAFTPQTPGTATDSEGKYVVGMTATKAEKKTLTANVGDKGNGQPVLQLTAEVTFVAGPPSASASNALASPATLPADGRAATTITLTARDKHANPIAGAAVTVHPVAGSSKNILGATSGTTTASGTFSTTLQSRTTGSKRVGFSIGDVAVESESISFVPPPWQPVNGKMWGGPSSAIALAPAGGPAGLAYLATPSGVYKTIDGGLNWTSASFGIDGFHVNSVAVTSVDGSVVVASVDAAGLTDRNGIYRSVDGAQTWRPMFTGTSNFKTSLLRSTSDASGKVTLHVVAFDTAPSNIGFVVHRSTDGGETWASTRGPGYGYPSGTVPTDLAVDPRTGAIYLLGGPLHTNESGTWSIGGTGLPPHTQTNLWSLAIDSSQDPSVVWVGTTSQGVFKGAVNASGTRFAAANGSGMNALPLSDWRALAADPAVRDTIYACSTQGDIRRTTDGGATWEALIGLAITDPVTRMVIDPKDRAVAWFVSDAPRLGAFAFGGNHNGAWKSTNLTASGNGATAAPFNAGVDAQPGALLAHSGSAGTLAVAGLSLYKTTDGAATWVDLVAQNGSDVTLSPGNWDGIGFDSAGSIYAYNHLYFGHVVRARGTEKLTAVASASLRIFGVSPALVGALFGVGVEFPPVFYRCLDPCSTGWTATALPEGLFPIGIAFGAAAGAQGQPPIYLHGGGAAKSTDGGATFVLLPGFAGKRVRSLAVDPLDANRIALSPGEGGLYLSSDSGATFTNVGTRFGNIPGSAVAIDSRSSPITLYFAQTPEHGRTTTLFRSSDGGGTWVEAGSGLDYAWIGTLLPDLWSPGQIVYAGGIMRGVFKTTSGAF